MSGMPYGLPRYRCQQCGFIGIGAREYCFRCSAESLQAAQQRVPCGKGHTRRPDAPCRFCVENTGNPNVIIEDAP